MRIAIVNDVPMMSEALRRVICSIPQYQLAWTAQDGLEAVERTGEDRPDLILMDLFMPKMNGAEATRRIMAASPCPILIVTATVSGQIGKVYEAMGHGALDAADTPTLGPGGEVSGASDLLEKIATIRKLIGEYDRRTSSTPTTEEIADPAACEPAFRLVLIGASTGGPSALADLLADLPRDLDACVIIVQHVDEVFARGLASWLGERAGRRVDLIEDGDRPEAGRWLLAGTNDHLVMDPCRRLCYTKTPIDRSFRPSVDIFFSSVALHWPVPGVAVLLTGMGRDGAEGLLSLRRRNWHTIAQDEATSVIWGMPRAAAEVGAAAQVLPLPRIARAVSDQIIGSSAPSNLE